MNIPNGYFVKWSDNYKTHCGVVVELQNKEQWILFPKEGLHTRLACSIREKQIKEIRRQSNGVGCASWISNFDYAWENATPVEFEFTVEVVRVSEVKVRGKTEGEARDNAIAVAKGHHEGVFVANVVDNTQVLA